MKKVIVVGGGAAGMMAAIAAGEGGAEVLLLEKNEKLGKKLFITGKGRCNVTNGADMETLFSNVCTNPKFLYSAFYDFDNYGVMELLERAGCPLKTERGERVFPVSDHSSDVIGALQRAMKNCGVKVLLQTGVKELLYTEERVTGVVTEKGKKYEADSVIVCTGGISYPLTGSTGDGYRFGEECGHSVTKTLPALVPLQVMEEWCKDLMGLSLKNVEIRLKCGKREVYEGFGEMLFTHFGVSGPLILSASSFYVQKAFGKEATLTIDLKPALSEEQLDKRLLRDIEENKGKQFKNVLSGLLPAKMQPVAVALSGINPDKKAGDITKEERKRLGQLLKNMPFTVTGCRDFAEAIITKGGVKVKEIQPSTMESKKLKGLFFAGEVLDLDALTGGYNLQIAWSTGYLAGRAAKEA